jgi:hypothetical protein
LLHHSLPTFAERCFSNMASISTARDSINGVVVTPNVTTGEQPATNRNMGQNEETQSTYSRIKYRVEYMNPEKKVIHQYETTGPQLEGDNSDGDESPVLELVTTLQTDQETHDATSNSNPSLRSVPPTRNLHIRSRAIMQALRSVVLYYPGQDLSTNVIVVSSPYMVLVHHYDELLEYRKNCKFDPNLTDEVCHRKENAYEHLGILKNFLDEHIMPAVNEEKARNMRGCVTFDMMWVFYKPAQALVLRIHREEMEKAVIVHSLQKGALVHPKEPWLVSYWTLNYDGNKIGRCKKDMFFLPWDGESKGHQLVDTNASPREQNIANIIRRGDFYWRLLRKQVRNYKGRTKTFPYNEVRSSLNSCKLSRKGIR